MGKLNLEQNKNASNTNTLDEIDDLFEEIKKFEKQFENFVINKIELDKELIDAETETLEEFLPVEDTDEINKPISENEVKNLEPKTEIKDEFIRKPINPVTFRFRFNNEGKLENLDIKKRKLQIKSKKPFILKRIKIRKKEKNESEEIEEISRFSKLKSVLAKLKRIIPNKTTEVENTEELVKEE